jgi:hypothetical protein
MKSMSAAFTMDILVLEFPADIHHWEEDKWEIIGNEGGGILVTLQEDFPAK